MFGHIKHDIQFYGRLLKEKTSELRTRRKNARIVIPRGRHTYGPQPEIVGPWTTAAQLVGGSRIGSFCSIAPGLKFIFRDKHPVNWVSTYPFRIKWDMDVPFDSRPLQAPIIIGNDVWIATDVSMMQGVTVGHGAVIAQGSFVTRDIPPYAIVGGHPAKVIRYRFSDEQIAELLKIAWWDWDDEAIRQAVPLMVCEDIDAFIRYAAQFK